MDQSSINTDVGIASFSCKYISCPARTRLATRDKDEESRPSAHRSPIVIATAINPRKDHGTLGRSIDQLGSSSLTPFTGPQPAVTVSTRSAALVARPRCLAMRSTPHCTSRLITFCTSTIKVT
jgi:hypothetical protein